MEANLVFVDVPSFFSSMKSEKERKPLSASLDSKSVDVASVGIPEAKLRLFDSRRVTKEQSSIDGFLSFETYLVALISNIKQQYTNNVKISQAFINGFTQTFFVQSTQASLTFDKFISIYNSFLKVYHIMYSISILTHSNRSILNFSYMPEISR